MPSSGEAAVRRAVVVAAVLGGVGVALGAFGAHGLEGRVPVERIATWETGVRYHLVHTLALLAAAALGSTVGHRALRRLTALWLAGTAVFAGSLYALVLLDLSVLGAFTPLGGILYIAGWAVLAVGALRGREPPGAEDGLS